jgi:hypothetical protein
MARYRVRLTIGFPAGVERAVAMAAEDAAVIFPNQVRAIQEIAEAGHRRWLNYASGKEALPDGSRIRSWSGRYLRSIQLEQTGEHDYSIYSNDPKARVIEEGASAWDLHDILYTSHKVRRSKKGSLYLIIPFRHGTPDTVVVGEYSGNEMPENVYERMREKAKSFITGQFSEPSVHDPETSVTRNVYDWGGRLTLAELKELGYDPQDRKTQRMAGMVRMDTSTERRGSSLYLTFRTLSENNPAGTWLIPERPGRYPAKAVAEWLQRETPRIMALALELDAEHITRLASV